MMFIIAFDASKRQSCKGKEIVYQGILLIASQLQDELFLGRGLLPGLALLSRD